eukprot:CAMPEP_0198259726 /NCGR_PEP_ID=MMETSP1447-20131203/8839_1 /TAXON_ID=420782 /ORGANISM="Chaetoceros dichaeta, Strain CCMP1751" /LENGTH=282 /DNA_ID=CAMNT_0043947179 /DNA_START=32 /DNA_END=880 /DNA_ORIENTATION=-
MAMATSPVSNTSSCLNPEVSILPQPIDKSYIYHRHNEINSTYFPADRPLPDNTSCRFLLSKGKNTNRTHLSPFTVRTLARTAVLSSSNTRDEDEDEDENAGNTHDRVKVQYPKGSTYNIRRVNLIPILQKQNVVIVVPETTDYRRLCIVHTLAQDNFIEIGSDLGKTIGQVVARNTLGIDKSRTSVDIAQRDYPYLHFIQADMLLKSKEDWQNFILSQFNSNSTTDTDTDTDTDLVVGVDINGNRELEAVRECVKRVLDWWSPRLVVVKSRSLFQELNKVPT